MRKTVNLSHGQQGGTGRRAMIAATLLATIVCASCSSPQTGQTASALEKIQQAKTIRAGWAPYPPYAERDPATGQVQGFYIDLFRRVGTESGLKIEFIETTWTTMIADLKTGKFDVMAAPVFRTIPRALEVSFTRPIDYFGLSAMVRSGESRFAKLDDFNRKGVRIATVTGEVGNDFARTHLPNAEIIAHSSGNISVALVDVIEGKADVGITDAWTIRQFVAAHANQTRDLFAKDPFDIVGAGWFVRTDANDLLNFLNSSIDWLDSSGALKETATKYQLASFLSKERN
jgi:ABC-type amino acid transport substrate-binding protein